MRWNIETETDVPIVRDADAKGFAVEPVAGYQISSELVVGIRFGKFVSCHFTEAMKTPGSYDHQAAGPQNEAGGNVPGQRTTRMRVQRNGEGLINGNLHETHPMSSSLLICSFVAHRIRTF